MDLSPSERSRLWRQANPEKKRAQRARHRAKHPEVYNLANKKYKKRVQWTDKYRTTRKTRDLQRHYQLTPEEYDVMYNNQKGKCGICEKELIYFLEPGGKTTHVDHDHQTGKVRGLLCSTCNKAIGLLGDNVSILRNAIIYLGGEGV